MTLLLHARTAAITGLAALLISTTSALADVSRYTVDKSPASQRTHLLEVAHMQQGVAQGKQGQMPMPGMQGQGGMGPGMMTGSSMGRQGMPMMGSGASTQGMPMMGPGMMQMMGSGSMPMMGGGMMMGHGAMGRGMGGHGFVVTPSKHLTTDDARHFFEHWIEAHGVKRLKVGDVKETDGDTITVEIVTVDDSLVQRFAVDRHSGRARLSE